MASLQDLPLELLLEIIGDDPEVCRLLLRTVRQAGGRVQPNKGRPEGAAAAVREAPQILGSGNRAGVSELRRAKAHAGARRIIQTILGQCILR